MGDAPEKTQNNERRIVIKNEIWNVIASPGFDGVLDCISASGRNRASSDMVARRFENKRREFRNIDT
jgi:hypothetical protein